MIEAENILISIADRHARSMLSGVKTVELRRRTLRITPGTCVWIYAKLPKGRIELVATVDRIDAARPKDLWNLHQERVGISRREFSKYFDGVSMGCAIVFRDIFRLEPSIKLDDVRRVSKAFQPPQFFKRLNGNCPELRFFASASHLTTQAHSH